MQGRIFYFTLTQLKYILKKKLFFIAGIVTASAHGQGLLNSNIHGNFQIDAQYYKVDSVIGAGEVPEKLLSNGFANFNYEKDNFSAGLRYENYLNPMLGFDARYKGNGIPYRFLTYKKEDLQITVGNFYEQFGSGMILRAYEERQLGVDNALDGVRVVYHPINGITLKGLIGKQRSYFAIGDGIVRGFDGEWNLNESITKLAEKKTKWIFGGSFVSKYQADQDPVYILPENVGSGAGRINMFSGNWTIGAEYVYKINDPSQVNKFIYKNGEALLVNIGYTKKGFGATLAAKRIDNMNFRSDRTATGTNLYINYLPALTKNHTYILTAIYPYATQPNGEMALQAEMFFKLKAESFLGGKNGADVNINYSRAQDIERNVASGDEGYTSDFFTPGTNVFFEDFNIEYNRKLSKKLRLILSYIYLNYDKDAIEGREGFGQVYSHIGVIETIWKITGKNTLRTEVQHLMTDQDKGNWALLLAEFTIAPKWSFAAFDQYNYGNEITNERLHYYTGTIAFTKSANRFSFGYGRQRSGILCVGGVCRNVPASNGFQLSITSSF